MFVIELLLILVPMLMGVAMLSTAKVLHEKLIVAAVGAIIGLALFTTVAYVVSVLVLISPAIVVAMLVVAAILTIGLLTYTDAWAAWYALPLDRTGVLVAIVLLVLCSTLATKLLVLENGGLYTGVLNAWGDLAWHMANITNFAEGQSAPPENPIFAGNRLTYPFLVNFFSGLLLKLNASYVRSVVLPALLLLPLTFTLFYGFIRELAGRKKAAIIGVFLLLVAGGTLGWLRLPGDWRETTLPFWEFMQRLPRDYTGSGGDADGFHFLNPILSLLLPQRSFLFGMPLALAILLLLLAKKENRESAYVYAGIAAGLLPLFHGHTVLALIIPIVALFLNDLWSYQRRQKTARQEERLPMVSARETLYPWLLFGLMAAIVGIPEVLYYLSGTNESASFFRWGPRWMAGDTNLIWYWFKNTGLVLPVTVLGLLLPLHRRLKLLAVAGLVIFIIANLFLFAPWVWDNSKLFIFWFLLTLPLVSAVGAYYVSKKNILVTILVVSLLVLHGVSGSLDLIKTALPGSNLWGEWDQDAVAMAAQVKRITPRNSVVLTAPYHNTPVALAGRRMYLGFPGHVWSHGGSHWQREAAIAPYYEGQVDTLPDVQPQFVLVGPVERQKYSGLTIRPTWTLVAETGQQQLYRIP